KLYVDIKMKSYLRSNIEGGLYEQISSFNDVGVSQILYKYKNIFSGLDNFSEIFTMFIHDNLNSTLDIPNPSHNSLSSNITLINSINYDFLISISLSEKFEKVTKIHRNFFELLSHI